MARAFTGEAPTTRDGAAVVIVGEPQVLAFRGPARHWLRFRAEEGGRYDITAVSSPDLFGLWMGIPPSGRGAEPGGEVGLEGGATGSPWECLATGEYAFWVEPWEHDDRPAPDAARYAVVVARLDR